MVVTAVAVAACGRTAAKSAAPPAARPHLHLLRGSGEARSALYPIRPTQYVLDGTLADLGADAPVYRLVGHDVSEADVERVAGVLGMHSTPVRTEWGYEVRDGDALLNVETNEGATWLDYSRTGNAGVAIGGSGSTVAEPSPPDAAVPPPEPTTTTPPPVDVPNADDAARIAQSVLDDLRVFGALQWEHEVTDTSSDVAVSCAAGTPCDPLPASPVSARTVHYSLVVDRERLADVGWDVTIGSHGAVDALSGTWAHPESIGTYALRPTAAVFADLQRGDGQFASAQPLAAEVARDATGPDGEPPVAPLTVRITGVEAGRARWAGTEGGRSVAYVVPTYRFHARAGDGPPYDVELLALAPASFTLAAPVQPEPAAR